MIANDQISSQELSIILREIKQVLLAGTVGDVVELGCYKGLTSLEIARLLRNSQSHKTLYLYDSFAGLPEKSRQDTSPAGMQFKLGELPASKQQVINLFKKSGMEIPIIKKAWFSELDSRDLPDHIALAFLDGDFYQSIKDSLILVWPKLSKGAVVIVDDYHNEALPGAQKAVDAWLKTHQATLSIEASLAILRIH